MKYMGSKARFSEYIVPILNSYRRNNQLFVDMFCGGLHITQEMGGERLANDRNKYLIAMWVGLIEGRSRPTTISRELYSQARTEYRNGTNLEFDDFLIGWIGWMGSYNGRFFDGGYSGHNVGPTNRDYIKEQIKNTESQIPKLHGVLLESRDYSEFNFDNPCLIYCDIPYFGTKQYETSKDFIHESFFTWVRSMVSKGHTVIVSEYLAPNDFVPIWEHNTKMSMAQNNTKVVVEKLFVHKSQLSRGNICEVCNAPTDGQKCYYKRCPI